MRRCEQKCRTQNTSFFNLANGFQLVGKNRQRAERVVEKDDSSAGEIEMMSACPSKLQLALDSSERCTKHNNIPGP